VLVRSGQKKPAKVVALIHQRSLFANIHFELVPSWLGGQCRPVDVGP
jgi:hypothetical protein